MFLRLGFFFCGFSDENVGVSFDCHGNKNKGNSYKYILHWGRHMLYGDIIFFRRRSTWTFLAFYVPEINLHRILEVLLNNGVGLCNTRDF